HTEIYTLSLHDRSSDLTKEMEEVMRQTGFKGNLRAFFDHLRTRKELMPFNTAEEVIANFNAIHERMKPHLDRMFDKKPKTAFERSEEHTSELQSRENLV